jgi:hypothetical protein
MADLETRLRNALRHAAHRERKARVGECDKCAATAVATTTCDVCAHVYRRCASCNGAGGARHALAAHRAIHHPRGHVLVAGALLLSAALSLVLALLI